MKKKLEKRKEKLIELINQDGFFYIADGEKPVHAIPIDDPRIIFVPKTDVRGNIYINDLIREYTKEIPDGANAFHTRVNMHQDKDGGSYIPIQFYKIFE
ncbi:MAG: hypothetical protein KJ623_01600 [Nanoarchaeota archaeon]|nr:hypothetical protein [Nanoarchaeota archaeon]MBU0962759.1 hypothetical protein [Nanoarchaeota archaeon]